MPFSCYVDSSVKLPHITYSVILFYSPYGFREFPFFVLQNIMLLYLILVINFFFVFIRQITVLLLLSFSAVLYIFLNFKFKLPKLVVVSQQVVVFIRLYNLVLKLNTLLCSLVCTHHQLFRSNKNFLFTFILFFFQTIIRVANFSSKSLNVK